MFVQYLLHVSRHLRVSVMDIPSPCANCSPAAYTLLWYSLPISSGPDLKLLASLISSSSTFFFLLRLFFLLCDSRDFLNTSRPLVNEAMMESTQLETFVWAMAEMNLWPSLSWLYTCQYYDHLILSLPNALILKRDPSHKRCKHPQMTYCQRSPTSKRCWATKARQDVKANMQTTMGRFASPQSPDS